MKAWLLAAVACLLAVPAWAGQATLESAVGSVQLQRGGKAAACDEGDELQAGDRLTVGANSAARIVFADGSHVTLSSGADAEIAKPAAGANGVVLRQGNVSAAIAKPAAGAPAGNLKFFVKTNAAVMGVRGTQFVADHSAADNRTDVHTLEGTVDVAKNDDDLHAGKALRLGALEHVRADKAGLGAKAAFDKGAFVAERAKLHAAAAELGKRALRSPDELRAKRMASEARRKADGGDKRDGKRPPRAGERPRADSHERPAHGRRGRE